MRVSSHGEFRVVGVEYLSVSQHFRAPVTNLTQSQNIFTQPGIILKLEKKKGLRCYAWYRTKGMPSRSFLWVIQFNTQRWNDHINEWKAEADNTGIYWLAVTVALAEADIDTLVGGRTIKSATGGKHHLIMIPMAGLFPVHKRFSSCLLVPSHSAPELLIPTMLKQDYK